MSTGSKRLDAAGKTSSRTAKPAKKRHRFLVSEPCAEDKRTRPEHRPVGLEALLKGGEAGGHSPLAEEAVFAFGQVAALAAEAASSLGDLWAALEAAGDSLSADAAAVALRRLPELLGAAALADVGGDDEGLTAYLDKGSALEAGPLPAARSLPEGRCEGDGLTSESMPAYQAFIWAHERVEAELDAASQGISPTPSLSWLAAVAMFYGMLRPGPPMPRHVLEDCADLALRWLESEEKPSQADVALIGRVALGAALSGSLGRHGLYAKVASLAAAGVRARENTEEESLPWEAIHDVSLALALLRPWDAQTTEAAVQLQTLLAPCRSKSLSEQADHLGASSVAGQKFGEKKENQDTFHTAIWDDGATAAIVVVDGHGKRGAALSANARNGLAKALLGLPSSPATAGALAEALMAVDAGLLLHEQVDAELSGATCVALRVEGLGKPCGKRRLALAHLGDCRAVLGRVKVSTVTDDAASKPKWTAVRLTEDHRPGEMSEASRLVGAGGRVRKAPGPPGVDLACLGPPRLWHRQQGQAPGLAMSRGLGDTLGKACGLSPVATARELELAAEDVVVVAGSDGIFDVLSDAEVLHCCRHFAPKREAAKAAAAVTAAARRSWELRGGYTDDCTCVVLFLREAAVDAPCID